MKYLSLVIEAFLLSFISYSHNYTEIQCKTATNLYLINKFLEKLKLNVFNIINTKDRITFITHVLMKFCYFMWKNNFNSYSSYYKYINRFRICQKLTH